MGYEVVLDDVAPVNAKGSVHEGLPNGLMTQWGFRFLGIENASGHFNTLEFTREHGALYSGLKLSNKWTAFLLSAYRRQSGGPGEDVSREDYCLRKVTHVVGGREFATEVGGVGPVATRDMTGVNLSRVSKEAQAKLTSNAHDQAMIGEWEDFLKLLQTKEFNDMSLTVEQSLSPAEWQMLKLNTVTNMKFHVQGGNTHGSAFAPQMVIDAFGKK